MDPKFEIDYRGWDKMLRNLYLRRPSFLNLEVAKEARILNKRLATWFNPRWPDTHLVNPWMPVRTS